MSDYHILELVSTTWLFTRCRKSDKGRLKLTPKWATEVDKLESSSWWQKICQARQLDHGIWFIFFFREAVAVVDLRREASNTEETGMNDAWWFRTGRFEACKGLVQCQQDPLHRDRVRGIKISCAEKKNPGNNMNFMIFLKKIITNKAYWITMKKENFYK